MLSYSKKNDKQMHTFNMNSLHLWYSDLPAARRSTNEKICATNSSSRRAYKAIEKFHFVQI